MTLPPLSTTEVIDIARQLEATGEAFYEAAAQHAEDDDSRALLLWLRDEERRHTGVFERVLAALEAQGGDWRLDEHYLLHMRSLAEDRVFPSPEQARERAASLTGDRAVLREALAFERASIAFFTALSERLGSEDDRRVIAELVGEEQRHIEALERRLGARVHTPRC